MGCLQPKPVITHFHADPVVRPKPCFRVVPLHVACREFLGKHKLPIDEMETV